MLQEVTRDMKNVTVDTFSGLLDFVFVVGKRADAPDNRPGVFLDCVINQKAAESVHGDVLHVPRNLLQHFNALLNAEEWLLFSIRQQGNNQTVKDPAASLDQIKMPVGYRIEGPWINRENVRHKPKRRARQHCPYAKKAF